MLLQRTIRPASPGNMNSTAAWGTAKNRPAPITLQPLLLRFTVIALDTTGYSTQKGREKTDE